MRQIWSQNICSMATLDLITNWLILNIFICLFVLVNKIILSIYHFNENFVAKNQSKCCQIGATTMSQLAVLSTEKIALFEEWLKKMGECELKKSSKRVGSRVSNQVLLWSFKSFQSYWRVLWQNDKLTKWHLTKWQVGKMTVAKMTS
jgi:hypothetical protein